MNIYVYIYICMFIFIMTFFIPPKFHGPLGSKHLATPSDNGVSHGRSTTMGAYQPGPSKFHSVLKNLIMKSVNDA